MDWFDWILIVPVVLGVVLGYRMGLIKNVLYIVLVAIAMIIGGLLSQMIVDRIGLELESDALVTVIGYGILLIAGFLSVIISQDLIEKNLGNNQGLFSIIKASLLGVPLPLCSCSVIPVSASLKKHGASKGAVTSFLFSTPQTGVDSIMVTYGMLGPIVALIRPCIALITGILCGSIVYHFDKNYDNSDTEDCHDECCEPLHQSTIKRILNYSFITLPKDIIKPLMVGIIIAALINIYMNQQVLHCGQILQDI